MSWMILRGKKALKSESVMEAMDWAKELGRAGRLLGGNAKATDHGTIHADVLMLMADIHEFEGQVDTKEYIIDLFQGAERSTRDVISLWKGEMQDEGIFFKDYEDGERVLVVRECALTAFYECSRLGILKKLGIS